MSQSYLCPVCKSNGNSFPSGTDGESVDCPRCGRYSISRSALVNLNHSKPSRQQVANLSGWLRENPEVTIHTRNLDNLLALKTPSVSERAEKLMVAIEKHSSFIGEEVSISYDKTANPWLSASWSQNVDELSYLVEKYLLNERNWLLDMHIFGFGRTVRITPSGYAYLDQLRQGKGEGLQGFCAMWFSEEVAPIWTEAIEPAIAGAGYRPTRIDKVNHNNRIDDEILAQIRRSRFVVADFTGDRGGVYFEAGFALGLGLQVIWTIRDDALEKVHFDNRQYNFLQWNNNDLPSFKKALQGRIEATLGLGPLANRE